MKWISALDGLPKPMHYYWVWHNMGPGIALYVGGNVGWTYEVSCVKNSDVNREMYELIDPSLVTHWARITSPDA